MLGSETSDPGGGGAGELCDDLRCVAASLFHTWSFFRSRRPYPSGVVQSAQCCFAAETEMYCKLCNE